jgi:short-subunit dehydrogenase
MNKTAFITGASSGIGAALAHELASRGYSLGLMARRSDMLETLATELRQKAGARVEIATLDVCEQASVPLVIAELSQRMGGFDIMIANAGITGARKAGDGDIGADRRIIETNLLGAISTIDAAVAQFKQQGHGHVVGISSASAYRGIPGSGAYSASKAALSNYLGALRVELLKRQIKVTVIHPGFVATDIAPGMEKYPFVATPEKVAKEMADAIERGVKNAIVPRFPWAGILPVLKFVPDNLLRKIF